MTIFVPLKESDIPSTKMKNLRPSLLILIGSFIYLVISAIAILIFHYSVMTINILVIIFAPLISGLIVFLLFYGLLKIFIQKRLHLIYKSIQTNQDLKPIKGLEIVNKINVYDYKWKSEDSRMDGVLAHELAEILPYAVSGVKDGEQMQSVDYSKIVPVMVQAIKELKAELDTLKNK